MTHLFFEGKTRKTRQRETRTQKPHEDPFDTEDMTKNNYLMTHLTRKTRRKTDGEQHEKLDQEYKIPKIEYQINIKNFD